MSGIFKSVLILLAGALLLISGCASLPSEHVTPPTPMPELPSPVPKPSEPTGEWEPGPRALASLRLTEQARLLLESKRPDEAIRTLERAVNIDPGNGRNYYYLAEAWLTKGNRAQAREFNRLAGIYLEKDVAWMGRVKRQKQRMGDFF